MHYHIFPKAQLAIVKNFESTTLSLNYLKKNSFVGKMQGKKTQ